MSQTIGFVLLEGFDFRAFWTAVEPLLAANITSGRELYRWVRMSAGGHPATSADSVPETVDLPIGADASLDVVVVCGGDLAPPMTDNQILWLRDLARRGVAVRGVGGAAGILSNAGVPAGGDAGRTAAFDMMLELIDRQHGDAVATAVNDWRRRLQVATDGAGPPLTLFDRFGVREEPLLRAIGFIAAHAAESPPSDEIARAAGVSLKKLRALFAARLGQTMHELNFEMRLTRARWLLQMTSMPIDEIAKSCGFSNTVTLVRAYRTRFGQSPKHERALADHGPPTPQRRRRSRAVGLEVRTPRRTAPP